MQSYQKQLPAAIETYDAAAVLADRLMGAEHDALAAVAPDPAALVPVAMAEGVTAATFQHDDHRAIWSAFASGADPKAALQRGGWWDDNGPIGKGSRWSDEQLAWLAGEYPRSETAARAKARKLVEVRREWDAAAETGISLAPAPEEQPLRREPPQGYKPFPVRLLPRPVRDFILNAAETIGCDPAYVALPLLTALAAAIGNNRRIRLKVGWVEAAVLWTLIIGDSGTMKSPALDLATRALRRRQERLFKEHQAATAKYREEHAEWKAKPREQRGEEPEKPAPCERVLCSEVTMEAVADRLQHAPRGLCLVRDEAAGWLGGFNQYKARGGGDVGNWLECHGGRSMLIDRKTGDSRTVYIPRASVSVCGGIQPGTLNRALTGEFYENGFCARILFAYPPRQPKRWTEDEISGEAEQKLHAIFDHLFALKPEKDTGDPIDVPLSREAKELWVAFVNECGRDQFERDKENLVAAFSKLEGYAARFALIIHQVRHAAGEDVDEYRIGDDSVAADIELARWFGDEAERVYRLLAESDEEKARRTLADFIRARGGMITPRELTQSSRRYRHDGAAVAALEDLVAAGMGEWLPPTSTRRAGRPAGPCFALFASASANEMPHGGPANGDYVGAGAAEEGDWAARIPNLRRG